MSCPDCDPCSRSTAEQTSGNVAPSRIDWGVSSAAVTIHCAGQNVVAWPQAFGSSEAKLQSIVATKTPCEKSAMSPIASSTIAYTRSGLRTRSAKREHSHAPTARPPVKTTSTSVCAYAAWPRNSLAYCDHIDSEI